MEHGVLKTQIGWCGVLLSGGALRRVVIGAASRSRALSLLAPPARGSREGPGAGRILAMLSGFVSGKRANFPRVRTDLSALTVFDRSVLRAVRRIPYGETLSYKEVARRVGRPGASRAVAGALSRNPVPIVIPCHRVIGSDGSLRGFSAPGGMSLKRSLLLLEKRSAR